LPRLLGSKERTEVLMNASGASVTLLTMPRPDEWLKTETTGPRKIELEDLLGRAPVQLDVAGLADLFSGQTVLVTGAGGSIGSELVPPDRTIWRFAAGLCGHVRIWCLPARTGAARGPSADACGLLHRQRTRARSVASIAQRHRPAVVFHAAAYKHVPLMEELNEIEALRTNVLGTLHAARVAGDCGARRFVMISTDKAVNPTNVMGASKRLAELMVQGVAAEFPQTQFVSRCALAMCWAPAGQWFRCSVPKSPVGGPVTVTHPDIVRYFMTIPEASQLVLQAD
jgi:FlaA1/EpsC-like NDP-sugar epimerase